jgi:thiol:disulfide interchange protein DsbD
VAVFSTYLVRVLDDSEPSRISSTLSSINWLKSEDAAFKNAKRLGLPILVDGWADWCVACKKMDKSTFVDPQLTTVLNTRWINLKLDLTESSEANEALIGKYGMTGLPTVVLLPPDGNQGSRQRIGGYVDAMTLLEHLNRFEKNLKLTASDIK